MRLLIATGIAVPEIGGPATHTALLQRFLPAHGVEVFTVPFRAVRYLPPVIRHFAYAFIVAREALRERVDVILSQDVCNDAQLARYGGHGYVYLAEKFLPRLRYAGITEADIETMTVANPRRILTIED